MVLLLLRLCVGSTIEYSISVVFCDTATDAATGLLLAEQNASQLQALVQIQRLHKFIMYETYQRAARHTLVQSTRCLSLPHCVHTELLLQGTIICLSECVCT